jgi:ssDNA-binding Zn-finger/Zn-ribbon topoisomerase 1
MWRTRLIRSVVGHLQRNHFVFNSRHDNSRHTSASSPLSISQVYELSRMRCFSCTHAACPLSTPKEKAVRPCPECLSPMMLKSSVTGLAKSYFLGCAQYPSCQRRFSISCKTIAVTANACSGCAAEFPPGAPTSYKVYVHTLAHICTHTCTQTRVDTCLRTRSLSHTPPTHTYTQTRTHIIAHCHTL